MGEDTSHLAQAARRCGRRASQVATGYQWGALVEADISRLKRVIGGTLRSHTNQRRAAAVSVPVGALNRMLELGRPEDVRVA